MIRLTAHRHNVESMDFFPDSSQLVTIGGASKAIWIWDLRNPGKPQKYFPERPENYGARGVDVVISAKSEIIFLTYKNDQRFLHVITWPDKIVRTCLIEWETNFRSHLRTARHRTFVVVDTALLRLNWLEIANLSDWRNLRPHYFNGSLPEDWVRHYCLNDESLDCFLFKAFNRVGIYRPSTTEKLDPITFTSHSIFWGGIFSSSGKYFVLVYDQAFTLFSTKPFSVMSSFIDLISDPATPCFTPDERYILFGREGLLHVVDIQTGEEVRCYDFGLHRITTMKISDDGLMVALAGANQQMVVVDLDL